MGNGNEVVWGLFLFVSFNSSLQEITHLIEV